MSQQRWTGYRGSDDARVTVALALNVTRTAGAACEQFNDDVAPVQFAFKYDAFARKQTQYAVDVKCSRRAIDEQRQNRIVR